MGYWAEVNLPGGPRTGDDVYRAEPGEPVCGRPLRCLVVDLLATDGSTLTVRQLAERLDAKGVPLAGRPSKQVSDALRWEVANGRVVRMGRGAYRFAGAPRTTLARIQRRARAIYRHLDAEAAEQLQAAAGPAQPTGPKPDMAS